MKTIEQEYLIHAPVSKVWQAFVNPEVIQLWGGGPSVVMDDKVGTDFRLWQGVIHGKNIKVLVNKLLVQEWYADNFTEPSEVTFMFDGDDQKTAVKLVHKGVPNDRVEDISAGWKEYYIGEIKKLLES